MFGIGDCVEKIQPGQTHVFEVHAHAHLGIERIVIAHSIARFFAIVKVSVGDVDLRRYAYDIPRDVSEDLILPAELYTPAQSKRIWPSAQFDRQKPFSITVKNIDTEPHIFVGSLTCSETV